MHGVIEPCALAGAQDAMETTAQSENRELAEELLRFFVEGGEKECFAALLFTCYDLIKPDVALEVHPPTHPPTNQPTNQPTALKNSTLIPTSSADHAFHSHAGRLATRAHGLCVPLPGAIPEGVHRQGGSADGGQEGDDGPALGHGGCAQEPAGAKQRILGAYAAGTARTSDCRLWRPGPGLWRTTTAGSIWRLSAAVLKGAGRDRGVS